VVSASILASPEINIQAILVQFPQDMPMPATFGDGGIDRNDPLAVTRSLFSVLFDNSVRWATEGWGGYVTGNSALFITPALDKDAAMESMEPLVNWTKLLKESVVEDQKKQILLVQGEYGTWSHFFGIFADQNAAVGSPFFFFSESVSFTK